MLAPSTVQEAADLTHGGLRPRRQVPQPGDGRRRRPDRPDDGAGRVQAAHRAGGAAREAVGDDRLRGARPEHRELALPQGRGSRAAQLAPPAEVPGDAAGGAPRDLHGRRGSRRAHRGLRHGGAHLAHVDRRAAREGAEGRPVPARHAVPVPVARRCGPTAQRAKRVLVAELSTGQMVEDVRAVVALRRPVEFYGRCGGMVMTAEELAEQAEKLASVPA